MPKFPLPIYPLATLSNTAIGIGIFALPYVASRVGLPVMLLYFAVLGAVVTAIHLMFADVAAETPDYKRFPGFAKIHLGRWGEITALICTIIGFLASMIAFMVIGGQFLQNFLAPWLGGGETAYSIIYFLTGSILIYFGINLVAKIELWGLIIFFSVLLMLFVCGLPYFNLHNLLIKTGGAADLFLPYGAILFAMWSASSIPEVEEMLARKNEKYYLKKIICASAAISALAYLIFIILMLGLTGNQTTESALLGLKSMFGGSLLTLCFFFGFITSFTSFIIIGLTLKKILAYDLKLDKKLAWAVTCLGPLGLYLAGFKNFIVIFSLVGGILLSIDGILIILMYQKVRPKNKWLVSPLLLFFFAGIIYEIWFSVLHK
jgi:amino acid permease